jgi:DNA-binding CsgD family transcriptional regulator/energy-coupling factor transporter ATP-binding protein EcfA2
MYARLLEVVRQVSMGRLLVGARPVDTVGQWITPALPREWPPADVDRDRPTQILSGDCQPYTGGEQPSMGIVAWRRQSSTLDHLMDLSARGAGQTVAIRGPAGCGKTTLLTVLGQRAIRTGARVLCATASEAEQTLPMGVLGQVYQAAAMTPDQAGRALRLMDEGLWNEWLAWQGGPPVDPVPEHILDGLVTILLESAACQPILITVDDAHLIDDPSRQCLTRLAGRIHSIRMMVVLAESGRVEAGRPAGAVPADHDVPLPPLSRQELDGLLRSVVGPTRAVTLATGCYALSGGNPALALGLLEDSGGAATQGSGLRPGEAYAQAVVRCLYQCGRPAIAVARALAVLGDGATAAQIARLADVDAAAVTEAVATLEATRLLARGRPRHQAVRTAILHGLAAEDCAAMHARAAEILYADGAAADIVAEHLMAADRAAGERLAPALVVAARQALDQGRIERGARCLRLLHRASRGERQRLGALAMLAEAQWRVEPWRAMRCSAELLAAARAGELPGRHALALVERLVWFGQITEATELLSLLRERGPAEPGDTDRLNATLLAQSLHAPPLRAAVDEGEYGALADTPAPAAPELRAPRLLLRAWGGDTTAAAEAERALRGHSLGPDAWSTVHGMLAALSHGPDLDSAAAHCDRLLGQAESVGAVTWRAQLLCTRAAIHLRRGDPIQARLRARGALAMLPLRSWGALVGRPLAILIEACGALDRSDEALAYLRTPVPEAMFQTLPGVRYLAARGGYHQATGQFHAALQDALAAGALLSRWSLDLPPLLAWRCAAARAWLGLDQPDRALELVGEHLVRVGERHQAAATATRLTLAAAGAPDHRSALLTRAAEVLPREAGHGDLAAVLTDLASAYRTAAPHRRSRTAAAHRPLPAWRATGGAEPGTRPTRIGPPPGIAELSDAERRVAALAAGRLTNRQIAARLHITVSTVEQHLTKIYRKLRVARRSDLTATMATPWLCPATPDDRTIAGIG